MPRTCTICTHPQRADIETALVGNVSYRHIASLFSVGYKSVERHADSHIAQVIQQSQAAREEAQALDVIKQLKDINTVTLAILKDARAAKKDGLALQAIDRISKQLELQAKLLGDIDKPDEVNVWLPAPWHDIELAIANALEPYMDARIAVAEALMKLQDTYWG